MKRLAMISFSEQEEVERAEAERKREEDASREMVSELLNVASDIMDFETSEPTSSRGKAILISEPEPIVLKLQEALVQQKSVTDQLKEDVQELKENQKDAKRTQEEMNAKLDSILALLSKNP
ncbi:hypothetical protein A2U01_0013292 [Trifolium medium]|uniref:Uncharacterized protein n=1 Tax=Trifolium medium TaxID=97028 RepID=A0A392N1I8_9FABA|nr:hypothetical protein [Trifolium medium]